MSDKHVPFPPLSRIARVKQVHVLHEIKIISVMIGLETLPHEVVETIVRLLDFTDVCSLRLTSSILANKSSQSSLKQYFRCKRLDLTDDAAIATFSAWTKSSHYGKLIKTLNVCSVAGSIRSEEAINACEASIAQAFSNLTELDELILEVSETDDSGEQHNPGTVLHGYDYGCKRVPNTDFTNWTEVWLAATFTFRVAMAALRATSIKVRRLDVFCSIDRCSLACNQLSWATEPSMPGSYAQLRSLSLSLSQHFNHTQNPNNDNHPNLAMVGESLERLLQQCPLLESLELHWFRLERDEAANDPFENDDFLKSFKSAPDFKNLKTCILRGLYVESNALLKFLSLASLQSVTMEHLTLRQGRSMPIFDYIRQGPLQELHLDTLIERHRICFKRPGKPRLKRTGQGGPEWIDRLGAEARKPIIYTVCNHGRTLASSMAFTLIRRSIVRYGPPGIIAGGMTWMQFV